MSWAELQEVGARKGVPVVSRWQTREEFLSRLKFWKDRIRALDTESAADLERKIGAISARIVSWPGAGGAQPRGSLARFPLGGRTVVSRPVLPVSECLGALPLTVETVSWATTDHPQRDGPRLFAWFDASDLIPGWYRISSEGSTTDTKVEVLATCRGPVLTSNDDDLGLQSRVVIHKGDEADLLLKVEVPAFEGQQELFLTLEGAGTGGIAGFVRDESTGEPIDNVWMRLYDSSGGYAGSERTRATGEFRFEGLDPGGYYLRTYDTDDYLDELWEGTVCEESCDVLGGDRVAVDQSTVAGIDFDLSPGASLAGTVTDAAGGLVTEGWIELYDQAADQSHHRYLDEIGRFEFRGLTDGTYFLYTDLEGYRDELWDDIPCPEYCEWWDGTPVALEPLQAVTGLDFQVQKLGSISGQLTDSRTGLPIAGASVRVEEFGGGYRDSAYSDLLGRWRSRGLSPGSYALYTDAHGYRDEVYDGIPCESQCDPMTGTPVELELEEEVSGIDFSLEPLGSISGVVFDGSWDTPLANVRIEAWNSVGSLVETGGSSTLGRYELTALQPDAYYVATDEDGAYIDELFANIPCFKGPPGGCNPLTGTPVRIGLGEDRSGIDFGLSRGAVLRGVVTDAASQQPLSGAQVAIVRANGALLDAIDVDSYGEFVAGGLAAGTYFVLTDSETHLDQLWDGFDCEGGCNPLAGTPVPLDIGQLVEGLEFHLVLRGGLSGIVTDVSGRPVAAVVIHAWSIEGEVVAADVTDATGFYQIDLDSGFCYLSTQAPEGYGDRLWATESCPDGPAIDELCDPLEGDQITVVGANPVQSGFDFVLAPNLFYDGFESGDLSTWSDSSK